MQQVNGYISKHLCMPSLTYPSIGNVYIADTINQRIRKVTVATGIITTIAGSGTQGYSGDNGPATSAELYSPVGVAVDVSGTHSSLLCDSLLPTYFSYSSN